jgi:integrase
VPQTITPSLIKRLKPTGKEFFVRDDKLRGFAVRVQPKGPITFVANMRIKGGRPCKFTLGHPDLMTVAEARQAAEEPLRLMRQGIDPHAYKKQQVAEKQREIAKDKALSITLFELFEKFMAIREKRDSTVRDYNWVMRSLIADWRNKPVRDIKRSDVEEKFISIRREKSQATAVKFKRVLNTLCNFAMQEEIEGESLLSFNPVNVLSGKRYDLTIHPKNRYLNDQEIHRLLFYAYIERGYPTPEAFRRNNKDGVSDQGLNYILLILYTGIRRSESERLRWEDIDFSERLFVLKNTKNGLDHVVPMSKMVFRLLEGQKILAGSSAWVFPSPRSRSGHISEPRSQLDRLRQATGLSKFTFHDLRRTFANKASEFGIDHQRIKKSLNHKSSDVTEAYIGVSVKMIRPVFEEISRGYLTFFDEELAKQVYDDDPDTKIEEEVLELQGIKIINPEAQF